MWARPRPRALGDGEVAFALVCDPLGGGTRAGESSPFRAERRVDTGPPLGARSLVAATCCVVLRQGRGLFPVARRLSEAVSGYSDQRRAQVGAGGQEGPGCRVVRESLSASRAQAQGVLTFIEPNTEFVALHTAGT